MENRSIKAIVTTFNLLELAFIILVLLMALVFQFVLKELPCPLCLLQRVGFLGIAFGFLLNLRYGLRPSHYGLSLLSALFTAFVALRQVALHVVPGTGTYGSAIFGLHMYTWSFVIAMAIVLFNVILLSFDREYLSVKQAIRWKKLSHLLFICLLIVAAINLVSAFAECGLGQCPDNPTQYLIGNFVNR